MSPSLWAARGEGKSKEYWNEPLRYHRCGTLALNINVGAKYQLLSCESSFVLSGPQLRAARGLLNISVAELAEGTGLAINTIRRAEGTNGPCPVTAANSQTLRSWFERAGVVFIDADELGAGVRLAGAAPLPSQRRRRSRG